MLSFNFSTFLYVRYIFFSAFFVIACFFDIFVLSVFSIAFVTSTFITEENILLTRHQLIFLCLEVVAIF